MASLQILEDLSHCIEMKINFPFEHLLLDCMVYSSIVAEHNPMDAKIEQVEEIAITYLSLPIFEVRDRILSRMYQRLRVVQAFS